MFYSVRGSIFLFLLLMITLSTSVIYLSANRVLSEEKSQEKIAVSQASQVHYDEPVPLGKSVLVNLADMTIELHDGTATPSVMPIISKGKPGSYYETPGGMYANDYKEPLHLSSIGHVYMPWSIHVFGNFFIHGIPYYPDGTKVSSTYSGGCIRLSDADAKKVYDFIEKGTPILIRQDVSETFTGSEAPYVLTDTMDMTRLMVAAVSLEFLTQDNQVFFNEDVTTRRKMLYDLLVKGDDTVSLSFASYYGQDLFIQRMNEKAKSLGLTHTFFRSVNMPAETTDVDQALFKDYIQKYKSYLLSPSVTP